MDVSAKEFTEVKNKIINQGQKDGVDIDDGIANLMTWFEILNKEINRVDNSVHEAIQRIRNA